MRNFLACFWSFAAGLCFAVYFSHEGFVFVILGLFLIMFGGFCGLIAWEEVNQIGRGDKYCATCRKG